MPKGIQLDRKKLRFYRERAGIRPAAVGCKLRGNPEPSDPNDSDEYDRQLRIRRNYYQRIEATGRTTPEVALRIAHILGTTLSDLTTCPKNQDIDTTVPFGPLVADLEAALRTWIRNPEGPLLDTALPQPESDDLWARLYESLDAFRKGTTDPRETTENIAYLIESAMLSPQPNPVGSFLARLLGLTEVQLRGYFHAAGLWLVSVPLRDAMTFGQIGTGIPWAQAQLEAALDPSHRRRPAKSITYKRHGEIYRIEVTEPLTHEHWWVDLIRVEKAVDGKGIHYAAPTPFEESYLENYIIPPLCQRTAWSVEGFSGEPVSEEQLRIQVAIRDLTQRMDPRTHLIGDRESNQNAARMWDEDHAINPITRRGWIIENHLPDQAHQRIRDEIRHYSTNMTDLVREPDSSTSAISFSAAGGLIQLAVTLVVAQDDGTYREVNWPDASRNEFANKLNASGRAV